MNLTINPEVINDTSAFYTPIDEPATPKPHHPWMDDAMLDSELLRWTVRDEFHIVAQKHNGILEYLGHNRDLRTHYKNDLVGAINESIDISLKYALIFGS